MWAYANGVALANPGKSVFVLGSDGSQMEGDDAEAARLAVAKNINIKLFVDDNDVTIAGHPSEYMHGFDVARTLAGHGIKTETVDGENLEALYAALARAFTTDGPYALAVKRKMAPGIEGLEGHNHGHESIKAALAIPYLEKRGHAKAAEYLRGVKAEKNPLKYRGSTGTGKNRDDFGKIIAGLIDEIPESDRATRLRVFDCDLEGSCGLHHIRKKHPSLYVSAGHHGARQLLGGGGVWV
jgi:transketolase